MITDLSGEQDLGPKSTINIILVGGPQIEYLCSLPATEILALWQDGNKEMVVPVVSDNPRVKDAVQVVIKEHVKVISIATIIGANISLLSDQQKKH